MNNLNSVLIEGNLTKDPELSYTSTGKPVVKLRIGSNRSYKKDDEYQQEASFFDITVWGKQAENCAEYLQKGSPVFIEGRLKFEQWETDGQKRSKLKVEAQTVQFLSNKTEGSAGGKDESIPF